ncbi:hypothetical protein LAUMK22_05539 [Mycobacterium kansasii]|nr:hypothetical protein MKANGN_49230 [Mycobacterium kansasii]VAZ63698.1 hypothetical protein LAUMK22_05539 [Mycobacterium kansasii]VAZ64460.1 hypothetical protein LAUMK40_00577 [Mycobacterium kansasii]VTO98107.1 hypothetical protein BIN_B_01229 [Mycobacterium kansasii]
MAHRVDAGLAALETRWGYPLGLGAIFLTMVGGRSKNICPAGKPLGALGDQLHGLLGCKYISKPSAMMNTPLLPSTLSTQV